MKLVSYHNTTRRHNTEPRIETSPTWKPKNSQIVVQFIPFLSIRPRYGPKNVRSKFIICAWFYFEIHDDFILCVRNACKLREAQFKYSTCAQTAGVNVCTPGNSSEIASTSARFHSMIWLVFIPLYFMLFFKKLFCVW